MSYKWFSYRMYTVRLMNISPLSSLFKSFDMMSVACWISVNHFQNLYCTGLGGLDFRKCVVCNVECCVLVLFCFKVFSLISLYWSTAAGCVIFHYLFHDYIALSSYFEFTYVSFVSLDYLHIIRLVRSMIYVMFIDLDAVFLPLKFMMPEIKCSFI